MGIKPEKIMALVRDACCKHDIDTYKLALDEALHRRKCEMGG